MESNIKPLNPIAFHLGGLEVHWYGIIIGCGIILGLYIAMHEAAKRGVDQNIIADLLIWAIPISIICARIYYVLFEWGYYSQHPNEIIKIWNGGIAIHGALIGAVVTAIIFTRKKGVSFWKVADIVAPSIILGQGIGRWGNFMNQEAHGREVSRQFLEHLHLPDFIINQMYIDGTYYQPTFLYESLWDILGFVILILLRRASLHRGEIFLSYLIWYSIGRFFVEGLRTDSLMLTSHLRIAQVVSIVLIIIGLFLWVYRRKTGLSSKLYTEL
ncbi:prolipoprotein diacylglyceryl transferase [Heyndrickxia ginsengihumi]|uniref:Phosphatidylglycerol--prolipoprotein diacylglyceryl transferase n=1 Tax=Heyndrickxia ginsengihumi TaxID=363870 RepID=A0A6M0P3D2_9BACI|nr:prolipoprotein diacylglyceryl transferase [Heyndrickxia ginsengihumi]MBE6183926.1 prolipoprotein diacylglyceryl transferase [Bacillus sp. (in: firmicutes)]MCM3023342.1 prolipoprotein diacylglyceryl transferase [Heyndrickxia ginsengihumi]NEY19212.1 prolipoprotein diacylglyceryl transferase [Heyndrickxia ginsengihumi]